MVNERVNFERKIRMGAKIFRAAAFKHYLPLTVSFSLTRRCNLECKYCTFPNDLRDELTTSQICSIIDQLKDLGAEQIGFTGGEPLLRDDFGDIVAYTHRQNILASVNTNGLLVQKRIEHLSKVSMVNISLDGVEDVNAQARNAPGAYSKIVEAIEVCKAKGIRVMILTVLSSCNVGHIDGILDTAARLKVRVVFQPAMGYRLGKKDRNPIAPDPQEYRAAMRQLIARKKAGERSIFNSLTTLEHLSKWPSPAPIKCWASKLHCRIDCNGDIYPCGRMENRAINCVEFGVAAAFKKSSPDPCQNCWCANMVEFNHLASLNIDTVMNMLTQNKDR